MIALTKGPIPPALQQNANAWTTQLLAAIAAGSNADQIKKAKYNTPEIKAAIKRETHNKCAYCESDPMHVSYGDIEHVVPKSVDPQLTYSWSNLTLACDVCNTKKGNKLGILDPYSSNPEDHLEFVGPMVRPRTDTGKLTCVALELNRTKLLERRHEKLDDLERRWFEIKSTQNDDLKKVLLGALQAYAHDPATEYSACISRYRSTVFASEA